MKYEFSEKLYEASKKDPTIKFVFESIEARDKAEAGYDAKIEKIRKDKEEAEAAKSKALSERKAAADKVKELRKNAQAAIDDYRKAYNDFLEKYGYWHESYSVKLPEVVSVFDLIDAIFSPTWADLVPKSGSIKS